MKDKNNLHRVYLGLGSNLGDREQNVHQAVECIKERIGKIVSLSSFFTTIPVGFLSDNLFINAACCVETCLHPLEILQVTQIIEKELGRTGKSNNYLYSDRIIDIDLLMFDNVILEYPHLVLPHPRLHEREFVMLPLTEIAKDVYHPIFQKTIQELGLMLKNNTNVE